MNQPKEKYCIDCGKQITDMEYKRQAHRCDLCYEYAGKTIKEVNLGKETDIQYAILEYLIEIKRLLAWRNNNMPVFQSDQYGTRYRRLPKYTLPGIPDICGVLPDGRAFFIEVKRPGNYTSDSQKEFIQMARKSNAVAAVARSLDDAISIVEIWEKEYTVK